MHMAIQNKDALIESVVRGEASFSSDGVKYPTAEQ